jgi:hypothetical protein
MSSKAPELGDFWLFSGRPYVIVGRELMPDGTFSGEFVLYAIGHPYAPLTLTEEQIKERCQFIR